MDPKAAAAVAALRPAVEQLVERWGVLLRHSLFIIFLHISFLHIIFLLSIFLHIIFLILILLLIISLLIIFLVGSSYSSSYSCPRCAAEPDTLAEPSALEEQGLQVSGVEDDCQESKYSSERNISSICEFATVFDGTKFITYP